MANGIQELAVVLEPAQTRSAPAEIQARGATAILEAELNTTPKAEVRYWAGTWPGVMAEKRPPLAAPRTDLESEAEPSHRPMVLAAKGALELRGRG